MDREGPVLIGGSQPSELAPNITDTKEARMGHEGYPATKREVEMMQRLDAMRRPVRPAWHTLVVGVGAICLIASFAMMAWTLYVP